VVSLSCRLGIARDTKVPPLKKGGKTRKKKGGEDDDDLTLSCQADQGGEVKVGYMVGIAQPV
jgi:hypothetical protein